jgi:NAD(P)-dependent dehydrogenase (short-subunit alcohol dehydrogenase family)
MIDLAGRSALVTGGAHRVGGAMVSALASCGVDVCIHYGTSADKANELAAACRDKGVNAVTMQADLAEPGAAEQLAARAEQDAPLAEHGRAGAQNGTGGIVAAVGVGSGHKLRLAEGEGAGEGANFLGSAGPALTWIKETCLRLLHYVDIENRSQQARRRFPVPPVCGR